MADRAEWLVIQHVAYEGPGAIAEALARAGIDMRVVRADLGETVPDVSVLDQVSGLVVMGGPMSVYDDDQYEWLAPERALLCEATTRPCVVLGVCLGAQQLSASLGADVMAGNGEEIGPGDVTLTTEGHRDVVFSPLGTHVPCMHWHGDTFDLPDGAVLLASNDRYAHQAFRIGERAYGLQFHVELTGALAAHWRPHLPPEVLLRAPDVAEIALKGAGILDRLVALAD